MGKRINPRRPRPYEPMFITHSLAQVLSDVMHFNAEIGMLDPSDREHISTFLLTAVREDLMVARAHAAVLTCAAKLKRFPTATEKNRALKEFFDDIRSAFVKTNSERASVSNKLLKA
jgi:hypothetical protein